MIAWANYVLLIVIPTRIVCIESNNIKSYLYYAMLLGTLHHLKKTSFILIKPVRTMLICSPRSRLLAGETMKNPPRTVTVKQVKPEILPEMIEWGPLCITDLFPNKFVAYFLKNFRLFLLALFM